MILNERQEKIYQAALDCQGIEREAMQALEEMAELTKEILKNVIRKKDNRECILEELSDVYVTLEQVKRMYGFTDEDIQKIADKKIDMLGKRLGCES